jgi:cell division protein FtsW
MPKSLHKAHAPDYFFMAIVLTLVVFGFVMLASASSNLGKTQFNNSYYYLEHQMLYGLTLGAAGFIVGYFMAYDRWKKIALPLLAVSIAFLALVFTRFGAAVNGTNRWLHFGPLSFQPAEIVKLTYLTYLAAWLSNPKMKRATDLSSGLLPFLVVSGLIGLLLILQPATSTVAILLGSGLIVYFVSGAPIKYLLGTIAIAAVLVAAVIYITPYRRARIAGFLHPTEDTQGQNYQASQALIAIGSGGATGVGYGQSASKTNALPAVIDDSIFAVVAEELGFVGACTLIVLFCLFTLRLFWLSKKTADRFGKFLLVGFGTVVALQAFVNMASISGIIPLTGVPLPFVSYGGTALAVFLTMSGIALNVSKYRT